MLFNLSIDKLLFRNCFEKYLDGKQGPFGRESKAQKQQMLYNSKKNIDNNNLNGKRQRFDKIIWEGGSVLERKLEKFSIYLHLVSLLEKVDRIMEANLALLFFRSS